MKIPRPPAPTAANAGRPLSEIVRQPKFIVAVVCGIASYAMMNMVMTAAPLAMIECNHSITDAALGLQWHVLGMYVPSFFTGALIVRFGTERVIAAGSVMLLVSAVVSIRVSRSGISGSDWRCLGWVGIWASLAHCVLPNAPAGRT